MEKEAIILIGAPGSGKGTQGELLEKRTGFVKYVMSSLIKSELKKGKKSNKPWAQTYDVENGVLLDDKDMFELFRERFNSENKIILDGMPRTLDQAYWLFGYLTQHKYKIKVLYIKVDEDKLIERILIRGKREGRKDDTAEIFEDRVKIFDRVKEVILEVYSKGIITINGDQEIKKVESEIKTKLGY